MPGDDFRRNLNNTQDAAETDGVVEGRNPVLEALRAGRRIDKLYTVRGEQDGTLRYIVAKAREAGAAVVEVDRRKLDQMSHTRAHQGVIAMMPARDYADLDAVLDAAEAAGKDPFVVLCDGITDPSNLGAIIRSAEVAGADVVVVQKRRSAGLTATVSKASAGALEHMPVARVANMPTLVEQLKKRGFWVFAADGAGDRTIYEADFTGKCALVIGSEGEGVSRLVLERCDFAVKIPMFGKITSLNASAAAAVILFEAVRQRVKSK